MRHSQIFLTIYLQRKFQDTSGRIVAYDIIMGTVLGVLCLEGKHQNVVSSSHNPLSAGGGVGLNGKQDLTWGAGGDSLAVVSSCSAIEDCEQVSRCCSYDSRC